MAYQNRFQFLTRMLLALLLVFGAGRNTSGKESISHVPKWQCWELSLKSSSTYTNPLQEAEVRVLLVSPLGETNRIYGFWDGGKEWKARFKPGFPGRWQYYTMCSDTANPGLHGKSGEFLCTASEGESRFNRHGPIQVARDQQHLEHADHTPFFWLGDAAWLAAVKATPADWLEYVQKRAEQKFNVIQWQLQPKGAAAKTQFFTGTESITVDPTALRQLDAKIIAANKAGLLNAIAPLWEIGATESLPEAQAIRLLRYLVARWGAEDVAWIIAFECDSSGEQAMRWQNICRAVFNVVNHAPVILLPGESFWIYDAFRPERWADVLGVQTASVRDGNSLPWLLTGPLTQERFKQPFRPLVAIAPAAEGKIFGLGGAIDGDFSRRLLWWNALLNTPAGVTYSAKDVSDWTGPAFKREASAPWREALTLPGAEAIASLTQSLAASEFWKLRPAAQFKEFQPHPQGLLVTGTESSDRAVIYLPEAQTITLTGTNYSRATGVWLNPRTGESHPAGPAPRFTPPSPGDWVLTLAQPTEPRPVARTKKTQGKIDN